MCLHLQHITAPGCGPHMSGNHPCPQEVRCWLPPRSTRLQSHEALWPAHWHPAARTTNQINISKINYLIVNCSNQGEGRAPNSIKRTLGKKCIPFRFLKVHITEDLSWTHHTTIKGVAVHPLQTCLGWQLLCPQYVISTEGDKTCRAMEVLWDGPLDHNRLLSSHRPFQLPMLMVKYHSIVRPASETLLFDRPTTQEHLNGHICTLCYINTPYLIIHLILCKLCLISSNCVVADIVSAFVYFFLICLSTHIFVTAAKEVMWPPAFVCLSAKLSYELWWDFDEILRKCC